jgi:hypothetical protein
MKQVLFIELRLPDFTYLLPVAGYSQYELPVFGSIRMTGRLEGSTGLGGLGWVDDVPRNSWLGVAPETS